MAEPKLIDMAYSKAELKVKNKDMAIGPSGQPDPYPWGLNIRLEKESLDKLGITKLPGVGDEFHFVAVAKVTSVQSSAREGTGEESSVGLQITMMQIVLAESEADEKGEKETPASEGKETPNLMRYYQEGK